MDDGTHGVGADGQAVGTVEATPAFVTSSSETRQDWPIAKARAERSDRPIGELTFGDAIEAVKVGKRVARAGWNGKGMFVYLVPPASYPVQTGAAKKHFGEGSMVPYRAYLALKTVDDDVATWAPSCSDALAEDWEIID